MGVDKYKSIIDRHHAAFEEAVNKELMAVIIEDLAELFKWWGEKFPKRKYDLSFVSGMGLAGWSITNFKFTYSNDPLHWYGYAPEPGSPNQRATDDEDRMLKLLRPLHDFVLKINETGFSEWHHGYPYEIGVYDYLWYENDYLRRRYYDRKHL